MKLDELISQATDKARFQSIENYTAFGRRYLDYIETGLQARIVSQNESHYEFFQYRQEGHFNITRPLNSRLMYTAADFAKASLQFVQTLVQLKAGEQPSDEL